MSAAAEIDSARTWRAEPNRLHPRSGKVEGGVKILLDLDRVLGSDGPIAIRSN